MFCMTSFIWLDYFVVDNMLLCESMVHFFLLHSSISLLEYAALHEVTSELFLVFGRYGEKRL